jgi:hypothetical protein
LQIVQLSVALYATTQIFADRQRAPKLRYRLIFCGAAEIDRAVQIPMGRNPFGERAAGQLRIFVGPRAV